MIKGFAVSSCPEIAVRGNFLSRFHAPELVSVRKLAGSLIPLLALWTGCLSADQEVTSSSPVAIVANQSVSVDNLSLDDLRRIFLADKQYWPDRTRIILLVQAPNAYERQVVLARIYQMNENEYKRYWVAKMFRAEVPSGPKIVFSTNMARELVSSLKGAITFIRADEVRGHGKILSIDQKRPGDPGYPLM